MFLPQGPREAGADLGPMELTIGLAEDVAAEKSGSGARLLVQGHFLPSESLGVCCQPSPCYTGAFVTKPGFTAQF